MSHSNNTVTLLGDQLLNWHENMINIHDIETIVLDEHGEVKEIYTTESRKVRYRYQRGGVAILETVRGRE